MTATTPGPVMGRCGSCMRLYRYRYVPGVIQSPEAKPELPPLDARCRCGGQIAIVESDVQRQPVALSENPGLEEQAAAFMRAHRHNWDTSEALDDLVQLLHRVRGTQPAPAPKPPEPLRCHECGCQGGMHYSYCSEKR